MTTSPKPNNKPKGQLLTIIIILIMGPIMTAAGLLQTPYIVIAVMFGIALIALGLGALYFYQKERQKNKEVDTI